MKYIQSYKQLLSQIAHECISLAKDWLRRYEERISREEERKKQLEKEKEYELQQRYLEEEEKKIRGYRRMDRIYAMWKEVFVEDTSTGTEGTSLSNEMKISQKEGEANIKNLSSQLLRINQPGSEFRKTENFSLEDFISKHDQEDDDQDHDHDQSQGLGHHQHTSNVINEKKSTLQHDGWINFRSNTSTTSSPPPSSISKTDQSPGNMSSIDSQAHTITSTHIKKSKEKRKSEHNKRKSTSSGRSSTPTSTSSSRKNENRISHTQPKNQTLTNIISPENDVFHLSPRVDSIPFEEENIPASLLIPDVLEDHPTRSTSTGRRICLKKCGCHINEICLCRPLPSPPSPSSAVNVVQINQELENKINNIYSEYDGELQAIWKKMTEQKKKSIRHRPHSANLSKVNDPNSVHVPQVDFIYGYGYQNFQEEESLINYERAGDNPSTIDGHHSLPVHSQKKISRPRSASSHYQKKSPRNSTRHSSRSEKQEVRPDTGRSIKYDRYNFEDDDHY